MSIRTWDAVRCPLELKIGEIHVWRVKVDRHVSAFSMLKKTLSSEEVARAKQLRSELDRHRYIVAHGALRTILARYLKSVPSELVFRHGPQGKPELASGAVHFNLSRSHALALCAVSRTALGVDVERVRSGVAEDVARWLPPNARRLLEALPHSLQGRAFFHLWTRMEAYSKARGEGLIFGLETLDVPLGLRNPASFCAAGTMEKQGQWWHHGFSPCTGYVAALVAWGGNFNVKYWKWEAREISDKHEHPSARACGWYGGPSF